jgi:hypothetical protein
MADIRCRILEDICISFLILELGFFLEFEAWNLEFFLKYDFRKEFNPGRRPSEAEDPQNGV